MHMAPSLPLPIPSPYLLPSGIARNFSQGVCNSNCLLFSTYTLHCFCRERNFDRRTRHHLPHFLNGNLTEVAEIRTFDGGSTLLVAGRIHSTYSTKNSASLSALMPGFCHVTRLMKITAIVRGHTIFDLSGPLL